PGNFTARVRSWDSGDNNKNWSLEVKVPTSTAAGGPGWVDLTDSIGFFADIIRVVDAQPPNLSFATQFAWPLGHELSDVGPGGVPLALEQIPIEPSKLGNVILGSSAPGPDI